MLVLCVSANAMAERTVLVILSSNSTKYQISASQAGDVISKSGGTQVVLRTLDQLKQSELDDLDSGDACLAIGAKAAVSIARKLDQSVPLIYTMVPNPAGLGLESRPNTIGISADVRPSIQFDLMRRVFGKTKTVGVLFRSSSQRSAALMDSARQQLPLGWSLYAVDMDGHASVAKAVQELMDQTPDFAWMVADPEVYTAATVKALLISAIKNKVRVFAFSPQVVKAGALIGIGLDPAEQGVQVGHLVNNVLDKGIAPSRSRSSISPVPQVAINKVVAKRIDAVVPKELVNKADYLYE